MGLHRVVAWMVVLTACGRLEFDEIGTDASSAGDGAPMTSDTPSGTLADSSAMTPTNDLCANGIDMSVGGTFMGTTCGAGDDATDTCNGGKPDVFYFVKGSGGLVTYSLNVSAGYALRAYEADCTTPGTICSQTITIIPTGMSLHNVVAERVDGTCGDFVIDVTLM